MIDSNNIVTIFFSCFRFTKTVWGLNRPECLRRLAYYSTAQLTLESSQPLAVCLPFWAKLGMQVKDREPLPWAPFVLLLFLFCNIFLIASIYTWGMFVSTHSTSLEVCNIHNGISLSCHPIPNTHLRHMHIPPGRAGLRTCCVSSQILLFCPTTKSSHFTISFISSMIVWSVTTLHTAAIKIRARGGRSPVGSK